MAQDINTVTVSGNLTRDPEIKETQGGLTICQLRLAVNGRKKSPSGSWEDDPNYFDLTMFGGLAETCGKFLTKGSGLTASGRLDWSEWTTPEGDKRQATKIIAETIKFMSSGGGNQSGTPQSPKAASDNDDSSIPF